MGQVIRFPIPHRPKGEFDPAYYLYFFDQMDHLTLEEVMVYVWRHLDRSVLIALREQLPDGFSMTMPHWVKFEEQEFLYFEDQHRPQVLAALCRIHYPINGPIRGIIAAHFRRSFAMSR